MPDKFEPLIDCGAARPPALMGGDHPGTRRASASCLFAALTLSLVQAAAGAQIDAEATAPQAERVAPAGARGRTIDQALEGGLSTGDRSLDLLLDVQRGSQYRPAGMQADPARDGAAQAGKTLVVPTTRPLIGLAELSRSTAGAGGAVGAAGTTLPSASPTTGIAPAAGPAGGAETKRDWVGINNGAFGSGVIGNGATGSGAAGSGATGNGARTYGALGASAYQIPPLSDNARAARAEIFQPRDLLMFVKNNLLEIVLSCGLVLLVIAGAKAYSRRP